MKLRLDLGHSTSVLATRTVLSTWLLLALGWLLASACHVGPPCTGAACGELPPVATSAAAPRARAPELTGGEVWLNTDRPLTLAELSGHVVVLDFWTYCCINCLHVLPELERLERRFADRPVVVIGVHSGKFDAEKDATRIQTAIERHGVRHPVVVDSTFAIWQRFGVRAWPTLVVIGPEGDIVHELAGEPKRGALERLVAGLLDEGHRRGTLAKDKALITAPPLPHTGALAYPGKVAVSPTGDIAVADSSHHRVVILNGEGELLDVAGSGIAGSADGGFEAAAFRYPQGLAFTADGALFVADTENHQIRRVDTTQRTVVTVAGTGHKGSERVGGEALAVALRSPWALAPHGADLLVAMAGAHQIWRLSLAHGHIAPWAGSGVESIDDGPLAAASFSQPSGLAVVGQTLYVADSEVSAIRAVDLDAGQVRTVVGTGLFDFGDVDGVGDAVRLQHALGVARHGNVLYVADTFNNKLKRLEPNTREVVTVAGGSGELAEPGGLAVLPDGRILIADTNHHRLVTFDPVLGALEPFEVSGLAPPATRGLLLAATDGLGSEAPSLVVKASGKLGHGAGVLVIEPRAPSGGKLTDGSPVVAELDASASRGIRFGKERLRVLAKDGRAALPIPVASAEAGAQAVLEASFFWCTTGDEQACYPARARLVIELDVGPAAAGEARVVFQATR